MLNEARARLANTRGKKAKRKAREKQLEEARRLSALQKKRELKSAGIEVVLRLPRKKKKEMNYNTDIPFKREVPNGTFATDNERSQDNKFKGVVSLQYLENRRRDEEEEKFKEIDAKRMKKLQQKNLPEALEKINKLNDPQTIIHKSQLILPEPQVTDKDLEGISKLSNFGSMIGTNDKTSAPNVLIGEYSYREPISAIRTPKVDNSVMREAKLAASLRESQTPLIGGEESSKEYEEYLNQKRTETRQPEFKAPAPITPNVYGKQQFNAKRMSSVRDNNLNTPLRDQMSIFSFNLEINLEDNSMWEINSMTSREVSFIKPKSVRELLKSLPKPSNNYEIDLMENFEKEEEENEDMAIEDAEDIIRKEQFLEEQRKHLLDINQSSAIKRKLTIPVEVNDNYYTYKYLKNTFNAENIDDTQYEYNMVAEMIREELMNLAKNDIYKNNSEDKEMFTSEELEKAESLIFQEINQLRNPSDKMDIDDVEVTFDPKNQFYVPKEEIDSNTIIENEAENFEEDIKNYNGLLKNYDKTYKKTEILTAGYYKRYLILAHKYTEIKKEIDSEFIEQEALKVLLKQEEDGIRRRKAELLQNIKRAQESDRELQEEYSLYSSELNKLNH